MTPHEICSTYSTWIIPRRWAAMWLDLLVLSTGLVVLPLLGNQNLGYGVAVWLLVATLYYPILEGSTGQSFGKWVCGLKVVDEAGRAPGLGKATLRHLVRLLEINPVLLGAIPAGFAVIQSKARQRFGDQVARTYVMRTEDLPVLGPGGEVAPAAIGEFALPQPGQGVAYDPGYIGAQVVGVPQWGGAYVGPKRIWAPQAAAVVTLFCIGVIAAGVMSAMAPKSPPTRISCAELLKSSAPEGRYVVTDCYYTLAEQEAELSAYIDDLTNADGSANASAVSAVFVPVRGEDDTEGKSTSLLLKTSDEVIRKRSAEMLKMENESAPREEVQVWAIDHAKDVFAHRDITGHLHRSKLLHAPVSSSLEELKKHGLTEPYLILNEGEEEDVLSGMLYFGAGTIAVVLTMMFWLLAILNVGGADQPRPKVQPPMYPQYR